MNIGVSSSGGSRGNQGGRGGGEGEPITLKREDTKSSRSFRSYFFFIHNKCLSAHL